MAYLTVRHTTVYRYSQAVGLGEHRMMFRPRASHDLRLIQTGLTITPTPARLRWLHDPFDNSIAVANFEDDTTELRFESVVTLEHFESTVPDYPLADYAQSYPFEYSGEDLSNLGQGLTNHFPNEAVGAWALQFLDESTSTPTMKLLRGMTHGIRDQFTYARRIEKGVQSPDETLRCLSGSCRDFAVLMIEGLRSLGIASRFVSGYIFMPDASSGDGGGATHAWLQAYLPGAGWIDFDPTNRIVGNRNLIRVGVAWTPDQVLPLSGTYMGPADAFQSMDVTVNVSEAQD
ncbi:MAG: transglutaminase family protein [Candidatus Solibacter sp.]